LRPFFFSLPVLASARPATQRQAEYSDPFGESAYTPELVIDGQRGLIGSNRRAAEAAIKLAQKADFTLRK
jgi:hypothetical protein